MIADRPQYCCPHSHRCYSLQSIALTSHSAWSAQSNHVHHGWSIPNSPTREAREHIPEPGEQQHKRGRLSSVGRDNDVAEGPLPSAQRFSRSFHRNKRFVEGAHGLLIDAVGATTLSEDAGTGELLSHPSLFRPKLTSIANDNDTHGAASADQKIDRRPQEAQSTSTGFSASVTNIQLTNIQLTNKTPPSVNH